MLSDHTSTEVILFFILYGITGVIPFIAAVYLLLRRGNAFAPDITPPLSLRRWAASFFAAAALGHVWWFLFYIYSRDLQSASYVVIGMLDCLTLLITIAGTLFAMLQDRKRPIWPAFAALTPFLALGVLQILYPEGPFFPIAGVYIISLYVIFAIYMVYAVRQYGRWLNNNYADLENKKVWLSQVVSLACLLLFIFYALVDEDTYYLIYILHIVELVLFGLLLWRVETLPLLDIPSTEEVYTAPDSETTAQEPDDAPQAQRPSVLTNIDLAQIEQLLTKLCVETQLYLQHDLTLQQLAQTIGTNRFYLSQYFSRQGITYNTYINNLRITHFISRYQELSAAGQTIIAQQLAKDSGYRSYSTFSLAFKQRTGQSVTVWIRETAK